MFLYEVCLCASDLRVDPLCILLPKWIVLCLEQLDKHVWQYIQLRNVSVYGTAFILCQKRALAPSSIKNSQILQS